MKALTLCLLLILSLAQLTSSSSSSYYDYSESKRTCVMSHPYLRCAKFAQSELWYEAGVTSVRLSGSFTHMRLDSGYRRTLKELTLISPNIYKLDMNLYAEFKRLQVIDVSCNNIEYLLLGGSEDGGFKRLEVLRLFDNQIKTVDGSFRRFPALFRVDLNKNSLKSFDFSRLPLKVGHVSLVGNQITSLDTDWSDDAAVGFNVDLRLNPIKCDAASVRNFLTYLRKRAITCGEGTCFTCDCAHKSFYAGLNVDARGVALPAESHSLGVTEQGVLLPLEYAGFNVSSLGVALPSQRALVNVIKYKSKKFNRFFAKPDDYVLLNVTVRGVQLRPEFTAHKKTMRAFVLPEKFATDNIVIEDFFLLPRQYAGGVLHDSLPVEKHTFVLPSADCSYSEVRERLRGYTWNDVNARCGCDNSTYDVKKEKNHHIINLVGEENDTLLLLLPRATFSSANENELSFLFALWFAVASVLLIR